MIEFNSPAIDKNIWKLEFRSNKELSDIFYEDEEKEEGQSFFGITEYPTSTVYINKDIDGFLLKKTLRHELMHIYLWEMENKKYLYKEDEVCELMSAIAPLICKTADELLLKLKEHVK